ncbi:MAG: cytochrome b [Pseudomonadota bacterium]|nr:cytochrome b [Pseudomonadota bacterium]
MNWKNTSNGYGVMARFFHIIMAVMLIGQLAVGTWMVGLPGSEKATIYSNHKTLGLILLVIVFLRLSWRFINVLPDLPNTPKWQIFAARSLHRSFYLMMIGLPISGWMMSTAAGFLPVFPGVGKVSFPFFSKNTFCVVGQCFARKEVGSLMHTTHEVLSWVLATALVVHISIALWHFHLKDGIFERIFFDRTNNTSSESTKSKIPST